MPDCCFNLPQFDIKKYRHWTVGLNPDQAFLGRTILMLNRHEENLWSLSSEEHEELWEIGGRLEKVLRELFHPDYFNYLKIGHHIRHLHLHVVPRYQEARTFMGEEFLDERWGQTPASVSEKSLPDEIIEGLIDSIREGLENENNIMF
jgi:diadenosine tetraphosphate (Ap4A) HIT family hydrolase